MGLFVSKKEVVKNSAYYQKKYRERLREQGLVKKEVWILPEYSAEILEVEKRFRLPKENDYQIEKDVGEEMQAIVWSVETLFEALKEGELVQQGSASVELIDGVGATIHVVMHDFGDLPIFLTVSKSADFGRGGVVAR